MHLSITINLDEYHVCVIYVYEYDNIMHYIMYDYIILCT